jgi:hypothetical protein
VLCHISYGLHVADMSEDIEQIWHGTMLRLCFRHGTNARNGPLTDYEIEKLRTRIITQHMRTANISGNSFMN